MCIRDSFYPADLQAQGFTKHPVMCKCAAERREREGAERREYEMCIRDRSYIAERPYLNLIDTYVDNGRTGTVFDRPEFNLSLIHI